MPQRKEVDFDIRGKRCDLHYYLDMLLPCPWPECPNGIDAHIVTNSLRPPGSSVTEIHRVEWQLQDGTPTFSWHHLDTSHVLEVARLARRESARKRQLPVSLPGRAYHYTNLDSLGAIVESQDLWLTDYAYLNDAAEISHGIELSRSVLNNMLKKAEYADSSLLTALRDHIRQSPPRICVACFSLDGDSLSQWRAYGGKAGSVALGFDVGDLLRYWEPPLCKFNRVIYDEESQRAVMETVTHLFHVAQLRDEEEATEARLTAEDAAEYLSDVCYEYLAFFKHPGFRDERECRLVYTENTRLLASFRWKKPPKQFRASAGIIVPYTRLREIGISTTRTPEEWESKRLPLREIVIGPQERLDVVAKGAREFLDEKGYHDVAVRGSSSRFADPRINCAIPGRSQFASRQSWQ